MVARSYSSGSVVHDAVSQATHRRPSYAGSDGTGSHAARALKRRDSHWRNETIEACHNRLVQCAGFELSKKLLGGKPEDATLEEVQELFTFMRAVENFLEVEVLLMYLRATFQCKPHDLEAVRLLLEEVAEDGSVSATQFHSIALGPGRAAFVDLKKRYDEGVHVGVNRDLMLNKIGWRVDRDEALATLPLTLLYMIIFLCLVIFHLQIYPRQQLERGHQDWIKGYGAEIDGPYLTKHVSDVGSFYKWLAASGLPSILSDTRNGTKGLTARLAVSSTLLGDVKLEQRHFDGSVEYSWLLSSAAGAAYLSANPGAFTAAAIEAMKSFRNNGIADRHISEASLTLATYEESGGKFVLTRVILLVGLYGHVHATVSSAAVPADPYPSLVSYPLDAIYLLLVLHIMRKELWEMWLGGISGFRDYWSMWNVIDWTSIALGFINVGLWVSVCVAMSADELHKFLQGDGSSGTRSLRPNIMQISEPDLNATLNHLQLAHARLFILHIIVAANTVSIIMRFFKAFQANQRLNIVAKTFASCYEDIVHFMIVFLVIFVCMAIVGHILFGSCVREFHTLGSSLNTCFMVLMGDFGWYVELGDSSSILPSGIPRILMVIWFFLYMFLVAIVLLNMLLAIILEKYSEVGSTLGPAERTLLAQVGRYIDRCKKFRGDIPMTRILADLEDKNHAAHPEQSVSLESLKRNFKGMSDKQAEYLMTWLQQEAFLEDTDNRAADDVECLKRTGRLLGRLEEQVKTLVLSTTNNEGRLEALEGKMGVAAPKEAEAKKTSPSPPGDTATATPEETRC